MNTLTTLEPPEPAVRCTGLLAALDDDDEWCIERPDNPDIALCGALLAGVIIPAAEVPDENVCPDCLRMRREAANIVLDRTPKNEPS